MSESHTLSEQEWQPARLGVPRDCPEHDGRDDSPQNNGKIIRVRPSLLRHGHGFVTGRPEIRGKCRWLDIHPDDSVSLFGKEELIVTECAIETD